MDAAAFSSVSWLAVVVVPAPLLLLWLIDAALACGRSLRRRASAVPTDCWFCCAPGAVARDTLRCCECDQYNGFTPDGDYDASYSHPDTVTSHVRYALRASPPPSPASQPTTVLCRSCQSVQERLLQRLGDVPGPEDIGDEEVKARVRKINTDAALCSSCATTVQAELTRQSRLRKLADLGSCVQRSVVARLTPAGADAASSSTGVSGISWSRSLGYVVVQIALVSLAAVTVAQHHAGARSSLRCMAVRASPALSLPLQPVLFADAFPACMAATCPVLAGTAAVSALHQCAADLAHHISPSLLPSAAIACTASARARLPSASFVFTTAAAVSAAVVFLRWLRTRYVRAAASRRLTRLDPHTPLGRHVRSPHVDVAGSTPPAITIAAARRTLAPLPVSASSSCVSADPSDSVPEISSLLERSCTLTPTTSRRNSITTEEEAQIAAAAASPPPTLRLPQMRPRVSMATAGERYPRFLGFPAATAPLPAAAAAASPRSIRAPGYTPAVVLSSPRPAVDPLTLTSPSAVLHHYH